MIEGGVTGCAHRPDQFRTELEQAGLVVDSLAGLEGVTSALSDLNERLDDPDGRRIVLDSLRAVESVPELPGASPHLLATTHRPG